MADARKMMMMAVLAISIFQNTGAEPEYCKRGVKVSEAYQHCFEEAHFRHPFQPLHEHHDIIDGCMVEAYATHVCQVVKPSALRCFRRNVTLCDYRDRILAIADESGGACYGNNLNREFKEHVLNFLEPVRGDSQCFILGDRAYECYRQAGIEMIENNPNLEVLSVDDFMPVANQFFESVFDCFIAVYRSNTPICENWQIPLLLEFQGTALPSLFGASFTPEQMDRLELRQACPVHHPFQTGPVWRNCVNQPATEGEDNDLFPSDQTQQEEAEGEGEGVQQEQQEEEEEDWGQVLQQQQQMEDNTLPPFLERLRQNQ